MLHRLPLNNENTTARCVASDGNEVLAREQDEPIQGESSPDRATIEDWVQRLAKRYDVDPKLVLAVIAAESNFDPNARSPKNAAGLMQLIPKTAHRFGVENSMDPLQNLHGGMAYLRWLLAFFKGDVALALAGYNAGEEAVERYRGVPPYAETRAYVKRFMGVYGSATHDPVAQVVEPSVLVANHDSG